MLQSPVLVNDFSKKAWRLCLTCRPGIFLGRIMF
jgi:hypothetical protein